jgi:ferredoxin
VLLLPTDERLVQVKQEEHIWDAAFATGISLPALCHQGYCLTRAAKLESPGEVDQSDSLAYFSEDREAGFILPCTGKPRSNLKIRTHQRSKCGSSENSMDFRRATAGAKNKISNAWTSHEARDLGCSDSMYKRLRVV